MTEKVANLKGLLDLPEEGLDTPATLVEVANAGRCPIEIVSEEDHDDPFTVEFNPCLNPAQSLWILSFGLGTNQGNLVITDNVSGFFTQAFATNMVAAGYPWLW
jgi:hypothetical protein